MNSDLSESRTVLVTGASRGIGRATSLCLLEEGWRVIGLARSFAAGTWPEAFTARTVDLADLSNLPEHLNDITRMHRDIDAVVLNAGRGLFGSLEEFSFQQIAGLMELNFVSQAFVLRALLPAMKRRGHGDVVVIGSESALSGGRRGAVYAASKAALRVFARALREECGKSGVRIGVINPGAVRSEFFDDLSFAPGAANDNAILPEEVAAAVVQMLSQRTGTVIDEINLSPLKRVWRKR